MLRNRIRRSGRVSMNTGASLGYAGIMLVAGVGIPVLATLNAGLGTRIGSAPLAAVVALAVALGCAGIVAAAVGAMPIDTTWRTAPRHYYFGGAFMAFYLLSITWVAPRFGVGNAIFFVLFGQIASAAFIDHFGVAGAPRVTVDVTRILGIALMAIGVFLARKPI